MAILPSSPFRARFRVCANPNGFRPWEGLSWVLETRFNTCVALLVWVAGILLLVAGCGGSDSNTEGLAAVEGEITFDGQPLERGTVLFIPVGGAGRKTGGTIESGWYYIPETKGPNLGKYRVEVYSYGPGAGVGEDQGLAEEGEEGQGSVKQRIPTAYNKKSTLQVEITAGTNRHDFSLLALDDEEPPATAGKVPGEDFPTQRKPQASPAEDVALAQGSEPEPEPAVSEETKPPGRTYVPRSDRRPSRRPWYTATLAVWLSVLIGCLGWWQYNERQLRKRE